jgi:2-iminobutanoate/2-iminopropanoate deaminase
MSKTVVATKDAPGAIGPYSQGIVTALGLVFTSGQIPLDPSTGTLVAGDIKAQTTRVMDNLSAILRASGSGMDHVVKTTVFLADMDDFAAMNEVYAGYFATIPPARSTVQVSRLPKDVRIEIEAVGLVAEK